MTNQTAPIGIGPARHQTILDACQMVLEHIALTGTTEPHTADHEGTTPACARGPERPITGDTSCITVDPRCKECMMHFVASVNGGYTKEFLLPNAITTRTAEECLIVYRFFHPNP